MRSAGSPGHALQFDLVFIMKVGKYTYEERMNKLLDRPPITVYTQELLLRWWWHWVCSVFPSPLLPFSPSLPSSTLLTPPLPSAPLPSSFSPAPTSPFLIRKICSPSFTQYLTPPPPPVTTQVDLKGDDEDSPLPDFWSSNPPLSSSPPSPSSLYLFLLLYLSLG